MTILYEDKNIRLEQIGTVTDIQTISPQTVSPDHHEIAHLHQSLEHDYDIASPNSARAIKEAAETNLDIVFPQDEQLQIDIDSDHAFEIYLLMRQLIDKYYGVAAEVIKPSRSGLPKRHITLTLYRKVSPYQRIALQACLGSDRVREFLGIVQQDQGDPHPILFLEKKEGPCQTSPTLTI